MRRCLANLGFALAIELAGGIPAQSAPTALVDPRLRESLARGDADFLVLLEEQPDFAAARAAKGKVERGRRAVAAMREVATRSQAPILERLRTLKVEYQPFWVANFIRVRGGLELVDWLVSQPGVLAIEANPMVLSPVPTRDEAVGLLGSGVEWGVSQIGADQVWALGYDGTGVVIAGQDTGYEWQHPALQQSYLGWDGTSASHDYHWHDAIHSGGGICGSNAPAPCDDHNHGTHTMGTMVGDDGGTNRIGVAPGARWIGCRNMDQGNGTPATYAECFQWFVAPTDLSGLNPDPARAPDVINNSWLCPPSEGCAAETLRAVVENARAAGIVVVASAGNSGSACSSIDAPPAIYAAALTVGATNASDEIAGFSSRGPVTVDGSDRLKPDVTAPGVAVRSSIRGGGYATFSGTSMAGPHVVGMIALLLDARPDLAGDVDTIEALVTAAAAPQTSLQTCGINGGASVPNATYGFGRVDAIALLSGDADEDGTVNLLDCRPADGATWAMPTPATDLRLAGGANTTLNWSPPVTLGATAIRFDVVRSERADDFGSAYCVAFDTESMSASDSAIPSQLFSYLVRAVNRCGQNLGQTSDGEMRTGAACP